VDNFWLALALKAVATSLVVVTASVVAERAGPRWGGLVASIPVSAGPAYVLLALQHDAAFIEHGALLSFAGGVATWTFLTAFVRLSRKFQLPGALFGALVIWLVAALIIREVPWTWPFVVLANIAVFVMATRFAQAPEFKVSSSATVQRQWFELPTRAVAVGVFVAFVVTISDIIGPSATGLAAVFPIALTSLAILTNQKFGIAGAASAFSGAVKPMLGIASGFAVLSLTPTILGTWPALALALFTALLWPMWIVLRRNA
jgi:uncharacterized membrane protein (GlpM family)